MQFWQCVLIYYVMVNICAFSLFAIDKKRAIAQKRRISERVLIFTAFLGGGTGALMGMILCHHKTQKIIFKIMVPLWLIIHIIIICFITFQNNHLVITKYDMDDSLNLKLVQVSDLHNVTLWWNKDYIVNKVQSQSPDIIAITGDIIDSNHTNIESALYTAEKLANITDTYYVTGNHEYWLNNEELETLYNGLEDSGVTILDNSFRHMANAGKDFVLIGIDDRSLADDTINNIMKTIPDDTVSITLAHEPQYIKKYAASGTDYVITGHAHGGQMILSKLGPLVAPDQGFRPQYTSGIIKEKDTRMIISRGLGNSIIPFRIFNYPELVVVDF